MSAFVVETMNCPYSDFRITEIAVRPNLHNHSKVWIVDGVGVLPVRFLEMGWCVVPSNVANLHRFRRVGPFPTVEAAVVYCTLMDGT